MAQRYEDRGDFDSALAQYRALYKMDSSRVDYFDGVRRNLLALGRYDQARQLILRRLQIVNSWESPVTLYAELGETALLSGDTLQAKSDFEKTIALGHGPAGYQAVATIYARNRRIDDALAMLFRGRRELNEPTLYASSVAPLLKARMDWQGAAREYLQTARTSQRSARYSLRGLASIPVKGDAGAGVRAALEQELEDVQRNGEPWPGFRLTLLEAFANRYREAGDYDGALSVIAELDSLGGRPGTELIAFASEAMGEGRDKEAASALKLAAGRMRDPHGRGVVSLAQAILDERLGRYPSADSLYTVALNQHTSPDVEIKAHLMRGRLRLERFGQAKRAAEDFRALLRQPERGQVLEARYQLARCMAYQDSLEASRNLLAMPVPGEPEGFATPVPQGDVRAGMLAARIALWQGKPALAAGLLGWVMVPPTGSGEENNALELLRVINMETDSLALASYAQADHHLFQGDTLAALAKLNDLSGKGTGIVAEQAAWIAANLSLDRGDTTRIEEFARAHRGSPLAERAWLTLADRREANGDLTGAIRACEAMLLADPDGLLAPIARLRHDRLTAELVAANSQKPSHTK